MNEEQRLTEALVEVMQAVTADAEKMGFERIEIAPGHFRFWIQGGLEKLSRLQRISDFNPKSKF